MVLPTKRHRRFQMLDVGSFSDAPAGQGAALKQTTLTWRLEPEESFSDWTIEVTTVKETSLMVPPNVEPAAKRPRNDDENEVETATVEVYHVHRHMLGAGPRSSLYFARMFRSRMAETNTSTSKIELDDAAAKAFPIMLDFMYSQQKLAATTESAVALRHLANYFGIQSLFQEVNQFVDQNIGSTTIARYVNGAIAYQDEKLLDAVEVYMSTLTHRLQDIDQQILDFPPPYFLRIIKKMQQDDLYKKGVIPQAVADYCIRHVDLDTEYVKNITLVDTLTEIAPSRALRLIQVAVDRNLVEPVDGTKPSLKQRAIEVAAKNFFDLSKKFGFYAGTEEGARKRRESGYDNLSAEIKLDIIERATGYLHHPEIEDAQIAPRHIDPRIRPAVHYRGVWDRGQRRQVMMGDNARPMMFPRGRDFEETERDPFMGVALGEMALHRRPNYRPNFLNQPAARPAAEAPVVAPARAPPARMPDNVVVHDRNLNDLDNEAPPRRNALRGVRPARDFLRRNDFPEPEEFLRPGAEQRHPVVADQVPNVVNLADSEGDQQARAVLRLAGGRQAPDSEEDDDDDDDDTEDGFGRAGRGDAEERNGPLREAVAMRVAELHNFRVAEVGRRAVVADAQGANLAGPGRADEDARPRAGRGDVQRRQHRASNMPSIDAANEFL